MEGRSPASDFLAPGARSLYTQLFWLPAPLGPCAGRFHTGQGSLLRRKGPPRLVSAHTDRHTQSEGLHVPHPNTPHTPTHRPHAAPSEMKCARNKLVGKDLIPDCIFTLESCYKWLEKEILFV